MVFISLSFSTPTPPVIVSCSSHFAAEKDKLFLIMVRLKLTDNVDVIMPRAISLSPNQEIYAPVFHHWKIVPVIAKSLSKT